MMLRLQTITVTHWLLAIEVNLPAVGSGRLRGGFDRLASTCWLRGGFDRLASTGWLRQAGFDRLSHRATAMLAQ
ncbi:hypothetical protein CJ255_10985 [Candidatus Viridilinea mediisalina]|uniref:Uncharacterized protein n=1 Tax=Candidatus Viridilinea mediisalina TaxID=2024553 RepID=A0A2A6RJH2_9CHLR|nr:hypothetical protein CJ255_10985 [Candidatus Viridilinea mediisalina]